MMKTVAVTAGKGNLYEDCAKRFTDRVNRLAASVDDGIPCINVTSSVNWDGIEVWTMCGGWIWDGVPADVERVIWIDSDAVVVTPLRLSELPGGDFCAVEDLAFGAAKTKWPVLEQIKDYFNSGVYLATRRTQPVFEEYKVLAVESDHRERCFKDQDLLNYLVWKHLASPENPTGWTRIDRRWNAMFGTYTSNTPKIVHLAGAWHSKARLDTLCGAFEEIERSVLGLK